jgi:hypothetical protein
MLLRKNPHLFLKKEARGPRARLGFLIETPGGWAGGDIFKNNAKNI